MHLCTIKVLLFWLLFVFFVNGAVGKSPDKNVKADQGESNTKKEQTQVLKHRDEQKFKTAEAKLKSPPINSKKPIVKKQSKDKKIYVSKKKVILKTKPVKVKVTKQTTLPIKTRKTVIQSILSTKIMKDQVRKFVTEQKKFDLTKTVQKRRLLTELRKTVKTKQDQTQKTVTELRKTDQLQPDQAFKIVTDSKKSDQVNLKRLTEKPVQDGTRYTKTITQIPPQKLTKILSAKRTQTQTERKTFKDVKVKKESEVLMTKSPETSNLDKEQLKSEKQQEQEPQQQTQSLQQQTQPPPPQQTQPPLSPQKTQPPPPPQQQQKQKQTEPPTQKQQTQPQQQKIQTEQQQTQQQTSPSPPQQTQNPSPPLPPKQQPPSFQQQQQGMNNGGVKLQNLGAMRPQVFLNQRQPPVFQQENRFGVTNEPIPHHKKHRHHHHHHHRHHHRHKNHHNANNVIKGDNGLNYGNGNMNRPEIQAKNIMQPMGQINLNNLNPNPNKINAYMKDVNILNNGLNRGGARNFNNNLQRIVEPAGVMNEANIAKQPEQETHHKHHHHRHHHKHKHKHKHPYYEQKMENRDFGFKRQPQDRIMPETFVIKPKVVVVTPPGCLIKTKTFNKVKVEPKSDAPFVNRQETCKTKPVQIVKTQPNTILTTGKPVVNDESLKKKKPSEPFSLKEISKNLMGNLYDNTLGRFLKKKSSTSNAKNQDSKPCNSCQLHNNKVCDQQGLTISTSPPFYKLTTKFSSPSTRMRINSQRKSTIGIYFTATTLRSIDATEQTPLALTKLSQMTASIFTPKKGVRFTILANTPTQTESISLKVITDIYPTVVSTKQPIKPSTETSTISATKVTLKIKPEKTFVNDNRDNVGNNTNIDSKSFYKIKNDKTHSRINEEQIQNPMISSTTEDPLHLNQAVTTNDFINVKTDRTSTYVSLLSETQNVKNANRVSNKSTAKQININDISHKNERSVNAITSQANTNIQITTDRYDLRHDRHYNNGTEQPVDYIHNENHENETDYTHEHTDFDVHQDDNVTDNIVNDITVGENNDKLMNEETMTSHANDILHNANESPTQYNVVPEDQTTTHNYVSTSTVESTTFAMERYTSTTEQYTQTMTTTEDYYLYRRRQMSRSTQYNSYGRTTDYYGRTSAYGGNGNRWGRSTTEETTTEDPYTTQPTTESSSQTITTTEMTTTVGRTDDTKGTLFHLPEKDTNKYESSKHESKEKQEVDEKDTSNESKKVKRLRRKHHSRHHYSHKSSVENHSDVTDNGNEPDDASKLKKAWSYIYNSWIMQKVIDTFKSVTQFICKRLKSTVMKVVPKTVERRLNDDVLKNENINKNNANPEEEEEEEHHHQQEKEHHHQQEEEKEEVKSEEQEELRDEEPLDQSLHADSFEVPVED